MPSAVSVPMAIAMDSNPRTSPITSLLLAMTMAATLFQLTVEEIIAGVTREAARALGGLGEIGTLEPGNWCNLTRQSWFTTSASIPCMRGSGEANDRRHHGRGVPAIPYVPTLSRMRVARGGRVRLSDQLLP
jgi:hypothetical protein